MSGDLDSKDVNLDGIPKILSSNWFKVGCIYIPPYTLRYIYTVQYVLIFVLVFGLCFCITCSVFSPPLVPLPSCTGVHVGLYEKVIPEIMDTLQTLTSSVSQLSGHFTGLSTRLPAQSLLWFPSFFSSACFSCSHSTQPFLGTAPCLPDIQVYSGPTRPLSGCWQFILETLKTCCSTSLFFCRIEKPVNTSCP